MKKDEADVRSLVTIFTDLNRFGRDTSELMCTCIYTHDVTPPDMADDLTSVTERVKTMHGGRICKDKINSRPKSEV